MRHVNRSASRPTRGATTQRSTVPVCAREARYLVDADPSGHDGAHDRPTPDAPDALSPVKRPYVGDYHGELHGAREAIAVGLPTILLALAVGFCVGAVVWAALGISSLLVKLLWTDLRSVFDVAWYPLALCTIGGLVIGLWTRFSGTRIELLGSVMGQVKRTGGYHVKSVPKSLVSFFLPLAFGGSIGPEAGLTGLIAAACTWIGTTLKRAGLKAKSVTDLTLSATLSAVFGTPFLGIVATADDGMPRAEDYAFRRPAKIVLYTAAAFGAFGGISLISSIPGMSSGLPRFGAFDAGPLEYAWFVPIVVAGWLLAMLFHGAETAAAKLGARLAAYPVLSALLCGVLIGLAGTFLPDVLFAGEEQSTEIMGTWTSMGAATLLLTGGTEACGDAALPAPGVGRRSLLPVHLRRHQLRLRPGGPYGHCATVLRDGVRDLPRGGHHAQAVCRARAAHPVLPARWRAVDGPGGGAGRSAAHAEGCSEREGVGPAALWSCCPATPVALRTGNSVVP